MSLRCRHFSLRNCCNSCHDDADAGYYGGWMIELEEDRDSDVCCYVSNWLAKMTPEERASKVAEARKRADDGQEGT